MFCCFRPPATQEGHAANGTGGLVKPDAVAADAAAGHEPPQQHQQQPPRRRSGSSSGANQFQPQQQQLPQSQQSTHQQQQLGQVSLEPLARLGEGAAQQAPGLQPPASHAAASGHSTPGHHAQQQHAGQQQSCAGDDGGQSPQNDVLQLVALLQELLGLSTASPKQPLSKAMGLLVVRLPVDWACLHVFSASGRVVMQVGAALSPEAQRQRGASGSCSYATPVGTTPVRQRTSFNNMLNTGSSSASGAAGAGAASSAGVQEVGAGHLAVLPGSGSSLELVSASRQALAMYAGDEAQAAALPPDWQRLYADRDMRSFLAVPIIASGSAGSIIGALSFGLTSITDWGLAWWMSSIQLLCGWAAGALPQNRSTARATFFDALWGASSLQELGSVFVQQLPSAMADQAQHKLEARLALVSSRVASCVMFAGAPDSRTSQERQQQQQQHMQQQPLGGQQQAPQQDNHHQQQQHAAMLQQQQQQQPGRVSSPAGKEVLPEGMILTAADDTSIDIVGLQQGGGSENGSTKPLGQGDGQQQQDEQQQNDIAAPAAAEDPVSRFTLPTANSVLLSALEWGEVMVVKDTVTYFGRNATGGSSAVRDLFLPDRPMVRGTLVLLPLVYRCRAMGCVYLLAPWDIHAELGKAALQEMAALLASGTFKALLSGGSVQADWYREVLSEGPMPSGPMPSVPELESSSSTAAAEAAAAAAAEAAAAAAKSATSAVGSASAAAAGSDRAAVTAPLAQADRPLPAPAALSAVEHRSERSQSPVGAAEGWGSGEGPGALFYGATGSMDSVEKSAASGTAGAAAASHSTGSNAVSCPLPLSTAEAVIAATAAAQSAAAAAAAIAPVGLPVCGHAASGFPSLVLWPELLDIKADLARSRHTAVYTAEYGGHLIAVKLFRYSTSMDFAAGSHGSQLHGAPGGGAAAAGISSLLGHHGTSSSSGGNVASEAELEAVLSLQYRLCNLTHQHLLQHVAVYPRVFEVVQRRSSREPPDVYLAAMLPRKERHHRCAALVTEHAPGGCLRDAVNRGQVHVPTPATLQTAAAALGWAGPVDVSTLQPGQLQELLGQVAQQLPAMQQQPHSARTSHDYAMQGQGQTSAGIVGRLQQTGGVSAPLPPPLSLPGRTSLELQQLREPHMQLLRQLLLHIALGMQHLHAHGIIHGELRLDNVMISGALPSTASLLQQQQQQRKQQAATAAASGMEPLPAATTATAAGSSAGGAAEGELAVRTHSSGGGSYSAGGAAEVHVGSSSSSSGARVPGKSGSSTSGGGSEAGSFQGFLLKLKDIGLCTLGYSNRQCTLRKLAGRARLQGVSWLAPECFRGEGLSKHSDVYAFGILMWELYTGEVAFNDLVTSNTKVLQTIIGDGVRPQFPDSTPLWYVSLASRCWAGAPKSRPSFRRIVQALSALEADQAAAAGAAAARV